MIKNNISPNKITYYGETEVTDKIGEVVYNTIKTIVHHEIDLDDTDGEFEWAVVPAFCDANNWSIFLFEATVNFKELYHPVHLNYIVLANDGWLQHFDFYTEIENGDTRKRLYFRLMDKQGRNLKHSLTITMEEAYKLFYSSPNWGKEEDTNVE